MAATFGGGTTICDAGFFAAGLAGSADLLTAAFTPAALPGTDLAASGFPADGFAGAGGAAFAGFPSAGFLAATALPFVFDVLAFAAGFLLIVGLP